MAHPVLHQYYSFSMVSPDAISEVELLLHIFDKHESDLQPDPLHVSHRTRARVSPLTLCGVLAWRQVMLHAFLLHFPAALLPGLKLLMGAA